MNKHVLEGCISTPISHYLKSLGLLRVLSEQTTFKITAYWKNEKFILETNAEKDEIVAFLLNQYVPTPILVPWSYNKYEKTIGNLQKIQNDPRFANYVKTIEIMKKVVDEFKEIRTQKVGDEKKEKSDIIKDDKDLFLKLCRNLLPDETIRWLDTVFVFTEKKPKFAPIVGSGGNDGNYDMAENFVDKLVTLLADDKKEESEKWLRNALFGDTCALQPGSVIGHNPDGDGDKAPNAGMGFTGKSLSNPWDYVLMMEGTLLFAGNMARRQSANTGNPVFPFSTKILQSGYATAAEGDESRGEIWVPIWKNPATYEEISHLFKEGRVQLNRKQAETGAEFARAIASLGTERGIDEFKRYSILKRKGKDHLYVYTGNILTDDDPDIHLLDELDRWYKRIIDEGRKKGSSESLKRLIRKYDDVTLSYCKSRKKSDMLEILSIVGKLQRRISQYEKLKPLSKLSSKWLEKCYDGSAEFRLASSVASIQSEQIGDIRENLENIKKKDGRWENKDRYMSFVWNENNDLLSNMKRVLKRRSLDGIIMNGSEIPIKGKIPAKINDIVDFLNGNLNMKKIEDLLLPLSMIDFKMNSYPWESMEYQDLFKIALPEAYTILKLIYLLDEYIQSDMTVINLMYAKKIREAYVKASQILHSHGMSPKTYSKNKGVHENPSISNTLQKFLMPSILFPISKQDRESMLALVTVKPNI